MHVAQINIGTMIAPTDDPRVAEFMEALDAINHSGTWQALPAKRTKRIWTDQYSNVWEILR